MKLFKKYRLQPLLIVTISLLSLLLLIIQGVVLSVSISRLISDKIYDTSVEVLEQKNLRLNERLHEIRQIALSIALNNEIHDILEYAHVRESYQQIRDSQSVSNTLSNIANARKDISQIIIVTDRMSVYNYANVNGLVETELLNDEEFFQYVANKSEGIIATKRNFIRYNSSDKYVVTFFRKLVSPGNKQELGILCIVLNENGLRNIMQDQTNQSSRKRTFIVDNENKLISPYSENLIELDAMVQNFFQQSEAMSNTQKLQTLKIEGEEHLVIATAPNTFGWRIVQFIPYVEIDQGISTILKTIIFIGFACFLIILIFLIYFSKSIIKPIKGLIYQMDLVGAGTFDISVNTERIQEMEELNNGFANMTLQIKRLLNQVDVEHQKMRQAELSALQSQINPHFLYNTLDSINWMAINIKAYDISKMVSDLGRLFRLSLNKGKDVTFIKNEIEHLRCYINIQSYRYNNEFTCIEEYEPEIMEYSTVKLILQPLVENCLMHGFSNIKERKEIKIVGWRKEQDIIFIISDNGSGVDPIYMNRYLEEDIDKSQGGYGIKNVNARIKIHFGKEYGLTYLKVDKGTAVQVSIPQN